MPTRDSSLGRERKKLFCFRALGSVRPDWCHTIPPTLARPHTIQGANGVTERHARRVSVVMGTQNGGTLCTVEALRVRTCIRSEISGDDIGTNGGVIAVVPAGDELGQRRVAKAARSETTRTRLQTHPKRSRGANQLCRSCESRLDSCTGDHRFGKGGIGSCRWLAGKSCTSNGPKSASLHRTDLFQARRCPFFPEATDEQDIYVTCLPPAV